jgi:hypothetical protein
VLQAAPGLRGAPKKLPSGVEKVAGETSLMVLCQNLTRVINTLGFSARTDDCAHRLHENTKRIEAAAAP